MRLRAGAIGTGVARARPVSGELPARWPLASTLDRRKIRVVRIFTAIALALVLSVAVASGASHSGLHGVVLIDPAYPVCKVGVPCTRPAKNVWLVFLRSGHTARTRTGDDGRYRITLPAGTYAVTSPNHAAGRGLTPARVSVRTGVYRRIAFRLDVGIR